MFFSNFLRPWNLSGKPETLWIWVQFYLKDRLDPDTFLRKLEISKEKLFWYKILEKSVLA